MLGKDQRVTLLALLERGGVWSGGCGWSVASVSRTIGVFESLARRGFVVQTSALGHYPPSFEVTEAGRLEAEKLFSGNRQKEGAENV